MLVLWLATGLLGKAVDAPAVEENASTGWIEISSGRRNRTRAEWKDKREEIRAAIKRALNDDSHEAKELVAAVEPFIEEKRNGKVEFDWSGIRADLQSVLDAVRDYREALEREAADEADEAEFLMMVA